MPPPRNTNIRWSQHYSQAPFNLGRFLRGEISLIHRDTCLHRNSPPLHFRRTKYNAITLQILRKLFCQRFRSIGTHFVCSSSKSTAIFRKELHAGNTQLCVPVVESGAVLSFSKTRFHVSTFLGLIFCLFWVDEKFLSTDYKNSCSQNQPSESTRCHKRLATGEAQFVMLSVLVHTQSLRFAFPAFVLVGVSPHFIFGWLTLRLATAVLPKRIFERLDECAYDSYQSLVAYFFETYAGTKVG